MSIKHSLAGMAAAIAATTLATGASAQGVSPLGIWIDHTGRGAVEIVDCSGAMCGHIIWLKEAKNAKTCLNKVLGNVKPVSGGVWDKGWIIDPDDNAKYTVELKPIGNDKLRVMGYMGSKLFSETMIWKRAPDDLKRCDGREAAKPDAAPAPVAALPSAVDAPLRTPGPPEQRSEPVSPAQPPVVVPPEPEAKPARTAQVTERTERTGKKKGDRQCTLDLDFIKVQYPCDLGQTN